MAPSPLTDKNAPDLVVARRVMQSARDQAVQDAFDGMEAMHQREQVEVEEARRRVAVRMANLPQHAAMAEVTTGFAVAVLKLNLPHVVIYVGPPGRAKECCTQVELWVETWIIDCLRAGYGHQTLSLVNDIATRDLVLAGIRAGEELAGKKR